MARKRDKSPITINITNPGRREDKPALEEVAIEQYEIAPDPRKAAPMAQAKARRDAAVRLLTKALKKGKGKKKRGKGRRHRVS